MIADKSICCHKEILRVRILSASEINFLSITGKCHKGKCAQCLQLLETFYVRSRLPNQWVAQRV